MAVDKLVDSTQLNADLTSVANAIRTKGGTSADLAFPAGFVQAIGDISGGGTGTINITENGTYNVRDYATAAVAVEESDEWIRPADWPDYGLMNLAGFNGVYLTYDLRLTEEWAWYISVMVRGEGYKQGTVERGHFDSNGNFVVDEAYTTSSFIVNTPLDPNNGMVQIFRCYHETLDTAFSFQNIGSISGSSKFQPCGEVYEHKPKVSIDSFFPYTVKSVTLDGATVDESFYQGCQNAYGLEQFIFKNSTMEILDSRSFLANCYSLKKIDFDDVTMNTGLNGLSVMVSIKKLTLPSTIATSDQNALNQFISRCCSLKELDLRNLDVTAITSKHNNFLADLFMLETLNMTGVNFSSLTSNPTFSFPNLVNLYPPTIARTQTWTCQRLSHDSLLRLFNVLPTVETTQTLTIGAVNVAKVTAEEIAIATAKGWTVA